MNSYSNGGAAAILAAAFVFSGCQEIAVSPVGVAEVEVTPAHAAITVGGTRQLQAVLRGGGDHVLSGRAIRWSSSDPGIAAVDDGGLVTGIGPGTAFVTAIAEGRSGSAEVIVDPRPVASVEVEPSSVEVGIGGSATLRAIVRDADGSLLEHREATWLSSDPDRAVVDGEGRITGLEPGVVNITARVSGVSGTATVRVNERPVASVEVTPPSATVEVAASVRLSAVVRAPDGAVLSERQVSWSSSNPGVASVDGSGLVTGVAPGNAVVTGSAEGIGATANIQVVPRPVATVSIQPASGEVEVGSTLRFDATARASDGTVLTGRGVAWQSANADIASVASDGTATGIAVGQTAIVATVEGISATAALAVLPRAVASVTVEPATAEIDVDETRRFTATLRADDGTVLSGRSISWASANTAVATVASDGTATGRAEGQTTITATSEGVSGTAALTVVEPEPPEEGVASVEVDPSSAEIEVGGTVAFSVTVLGEDGNVLTGRAVTWQSGNTAVATVTSDGTATGHSAGQVTISATVEGVSGTATLSVVQSEPPEEGVASVEVEPTTAEVEVDGTITFTATVLGEDGNVLTDRTVTWQSGNTAVATVSSDGTATGHAEGQATITATVEGVSGSATLTVAGSSSTTVASVTVEPSTLIVNSGERGQLTAVVRAEDGTLLTGLAVTWTTSDHRVAEVDSNGNVHGKKKGEATVTATVSGISGSALVEVRD